MQNVTYNFVYKQMAGYLGKPTLWKCLMKCIEQQYAIKWTDRADGRFKIMNVTKFRRRWNEQGGRVKTDENVLRAFRVYTKEGRMKKIHEGHKSIDEYQLNRATMCAHKFY